MNMLLRMMPLALIAATALAQEATYKNDFEAVEVGKMPTEIMVHDGAFAVAEEGGNKFLELPGAPLDTFTVLFGSTEKENRVVSARIFGTSKGRRAPTFNVGLNGIGGYKLQVSPGKKAVELLKSDAPKTSVPFNWVSGKWTRLSLALKKVGDSEWKIEGRVWEDGAAEPASPTITFSDNEAPSAGKASVGGSPYATTPIRFDDIASAPAK